MFYQILYLRSLHFELEEEKKFEEQSNSNTPLVINKNLIISNQNVHGKTIDELKIRFMTKANISRIMKPNQLPISPTKDTVLERSFHVKSNVNFKHIFRRAVGVRKLKPGRNPISVN